MRKGRCFTDGETASSTFLGIFLSQITKIMKSKFTALKLFERKFTRGSPMLTTVEYLHVCREMLIMIQYTLYQQPNRYLKILDWLQKSFCQNYIHEKHDYKFFCPFSNKATFIHISTLFSPISNLQNYFVMSLFYVFLSLICSDAI